jgi:hypothetical protein
VQNHNPIIRKMLCKMFEKEENYDLCAEAENGEQAIELALRHRPDLIHSRFINAYHEWPRSGARTEKTDAKSADNLVHPTRRARKSSRYSQTDVDRIVAKAEAFSLMGHVGRLRPRAESYFILIGG